MAITRTVRNSGANRTGETQTVISATCNAGSALLVAIANDGTNISSVTWNGITLLSVAQGTSATTTSSIFATYNVPATATANVTITWAATCSSKAIVVTEVTEIGPTALGNGAIGTGTAPSAGPTSALSVPNAFIWGVIGTDGPSGDVAGTWQNSFTAGTRVGSTGGQAATNSTVDTGFRIVSAAGSFTAAKTGITSRDWSAAVAAFPAMVTAPTFSVASGSTVTPGSTVTISTTTSGATIYYTTDGSTPTTSSTQYTGPVTINASLTLKAIAVATGYNNSPVSTATYTAQAPEPTDPSFKLIQSAKTATDNFTGSITVNLPSGATAGNLILLVAGVDKNPTSISVPAGFTKAAAQETGPSAGGVVAYKVATGGEQSFTVTFGSATVSKPCLMAFEYDGFTGTPFVTGLATGNSGSTAVSTLGTGSITATTENAVFVVSVVDSVPAGWAGTRTWSDSFTEVEAMSVGSSGATSVAVKRVWTGGATSATFSWTADATTDGTDQVATFIVAFKLNSETFPVTTPTYSTATKVQEFGSARTFSTTTSMVLRMPRATQTGNLLVAHVATTAASLGTFTATGWTIVKQFSNANFGGFVAYKTSAGERDFTFSWTNAGAGVASIVEYGGMRASPLGAYAATNTVSTDNTLIPPTLTTTSSKSVVFVSAVADLYTQGAATPSTYFNPSWSNTFATESFAGEGAANSAIIIASRLMTSQGATAATTGTVTGNAHTYTTFAVEFAAADGTAPTPTDQSPVSSSSSSSSSSSGAATPPATITLVQQGVASNANVAVTTLTVSLPSPATAGNTILLFVGIDKTPGTITYPTGFTKIQSYDANGGNEQVAINGAVLYKVATGGEQDFTVTWTTANRPTFYVLEYSGLGALNASDKNSYTSTVSTALTQTITPTANTRVWAVAMGDSVNGATSDWDSAFTELYDYSNGTSGSGNACVSVAWKDVSSGVATSATCTRSGVAPNDVDETITFIFAFEGGSGGGGASSTSSSSSSTVSGPPVLVQSKGAHTSDVAQATVSVTLDTPATAGNLLVLVAGLDKNPAITAMSPSTGWTLFVDNGNAGVGTEIYWKIADGGEQTFSYTVGVTTTRPSIAILEYRNFNSAAPINASNSATTASPNAGAASLSTGSITTTVADTVVVVCGFVDSTASVTSADAFSGFPNKVLTTGTVGNAYIGIAANTYTSIQTGLSSTFSYTGTVDEITTAIFAIAGGTSGGGGTPSSDTQLIQSAYNKTDAFVNNSFSVTLSQAPVAGNVLLAFFAVDKDTGTINVPTGFTAIQNVPSTANSLGGFVAYKVADGTESVITATWANPGGTAISKCTFHVQEWSNLGTTFVSGQSSSGDTAVNTLTTATITTPGTTAKVFAFSAIDSVNSTATSWVTDRSWTNGFTEIAFSPQTLSNDGYPGTSIATKDVTSSGSQSSTFSWVTGTDQTFTIILAATSVPSSGGTPSVSVSWTVVGAATSTGATVIMNTSAAASMSLKIYKMPENEFVMQTSSVSTSAASTYNLVKVPITGLLPNTQYKYVPNDGNGDVTANTGYFTTFPQGAGSYKFVHYSCNNVPNNVLFSTMAAKNPLLIVCMGDFHYTDTNSTTESSYYPMLNTAYSASNHRLCLNKMPLVRIWDDHDFCGNDSTGASVGKPYSAAAYRKFTASYALPDPNGWAVYQSFVVGRVRFVIMDVRSEKDNSTQIISSNQMAWVKRELLAAKNAGQVVCLGSGNAWIGNGASNDADAWGGAGGPAQRQELATYIRQIQMNRSVFLISGDAHMLAADDGTNNTYGVGGGANFRVFHGAALSQNGSTKGGPYFYAGASGRSRANSATGEANGQYAEVDVEDTGGKWIKFTWTGHFSSSDTVWLSVVFHLLVPDSAKRRAV